MEHAIGTPDTSGVFKVQNNYGKICIGAKCKLGGVAFQSIYASPTEVTGELPFTPVNKVKVWFSLSDKTGSMISDATSNYIEVDLTEAKTASIAYEGEDPGNGHWVVKQ